MNLSQFIEDKLNYYAEAIVRGNEKMDEHALGELTFYMALRRVLDKTHTYQDVGMMDAINDTLQELGMIASDKVFYHGNDE